MLQGTTMTEHPQVYHNFPLRIVLYRAALLVVTVLLGGIVSALAGWVWLGVYLVWAVLAIVITLKLACRNCDYHGKRCDLGISLLATALHPAPATPEKFRRGMKTAVWYLAIMLAIPLLIGVVNQVVLLTSTDPNAEFFSELMKGPFVALGFAVTISNALDFSPYVNLFWLVVYALAIAVTIWTSTRSCPHCQMRTRCPLSFYRPT